MLNSRLAWTSEQEATLKRVYGTVHNGALLEMFPQRSIPAIQKKARKLGLKQSAEMEFENRSAARSGEKCPNWNSGTRRTARGYVQVLCKGHPRADSSGYVMEHIIVWENATGVSVTPEFVIHHLDGNKANNRIDNLCMMPFGAHSSFHNRSRRRAL